RLFLEYAERGAKAYSSEHATTDGRARVALLEDDVARALETRGHRVERDVGCSTYRLDVAVLHPERPGEYLLGVECDGSMYASARTARDRDRLRSSVLEGLGWRVHRVWAIEWWRDREREIARIEAAIDAALRGDRPQDPSIASSGAA